MSHCSIAGKKQNSSGYGYNLIIRINGKKAIIFLKKSNQSTKELGVGCYFVLTFDSKTQIRRSKESSSSSSSSSCQLVASTQVGRMIGLIQMRNSRQKSRHNWSFQWQMRHKD
jgi:hypothetical protein